MKKNMIKSPDNYTAKDLLDYWFNQLLQIKGTERSHSGFIGVELRKLKELLDVYGSYSIMYVMHKAIGLGNLSFNNVVDNCSDYLSDYPYAKLWYWVDKKGGKEQQEWLLTLNTFITKWLPLASDIQVRRKIEHDAMEWVDYIQLNIS